MVLIMNKYWFSIFLSIFQSEKEHDAKLAEQRQKQQELIQQLKSQLEDLENYAYQVNGVYKPGEGVARV